MHTLGGIIVTQGLPGEGSVSVDTRFVLKTKLLIAENVVRFIIIELLLWFLLIRHHCKRPVSTSEATV